MARFSSEVELETFLGELDPDYSQFASALWQKGVKTARQLAMLQSHFYYLGVCQSCTSMTSKPQLIGQVSSVHSLVVHQGILLARSSLITHLECCGYCMPAQSDGTYIPILSMFPSCCLVWQI